MWPPAIVIYKLPHLMRMYFVLLVYRERNSISLNVFIHIFLLHFSFHLQLGNSSSVFTDIFIAAMTTFRFCMIHA